jgi:hypothetical protein
VLVGCLPFLAAMGALLAKAATAGNTKSQDAYTQVGPRPRPHLHIQTASRDRPGCPPARRAPARRLDRRPVLTLPR